MQRYTRSIKKKVLEVVWLLSCTHARALDGIRPSVVRFGAVRGSYPRHHHHEP